MSTHFQAGFTRTVLHSAARGGYYAEVWTRAGKLVHTTAICKSGHEARSMADAWIAERKATVRR